MKIQKRQSQVPSHEVWRLWGIQNVNSAGFAGLSFSSGCDSHKTLQSELVSPRSSLSRLAMGNGVPSVAARPETVLRKTSLPAIRSFRSGVLGVLGLTLYLAGCVGTTGGELVTFDAFGAGPEDAAEGQPYSFTNSRGYTITLDRAVVYIGAVYLNRSRPTSVGSDTGCFLSGIYGAEVTNGRFVDILSPELQAFPEPGFGTTDRAFTGEVWLFGGTDVNDTHDPTVILDVAGTAEKDGISYPFEGQVTISENRVEETSSPAQPGSDPICKQRVVTPIPVDIQLADGGSLVVRVDPRGMFANVQFSALTLVQESPPLYQFVDSGDDAPSRNLYSGLRAAEGTYFFEATGQQ